MGHISAIFEEKNKKQKKNVPSLRDTLYHRLLPGRFKEQKACLVEMK